MLATTPNRLHTLAVEQAHRGRGTGPWESDHAFQVIVLDLIGLAAILASAYQAHDAARPAGSLAWTNLAVVGVAISLFANVRWFLRGREMVSLAQANIVQRGLVVASHLSEVAPTEDSAVVALRASGYFHRPACALVEGRNTLATDRTVHEVAERAACPICRP